MPKSRNQSPARSVGIGTPNTSSSNYTRRKTKMSRSVGSPAQNTSLKLSTVVSRLKENDIPSFNLSVDSVLSDNTQIEQPKRRSWWKRVQDTSRSVLEILENNQINEREVNDIIQEYVDVDVLSQEKRNQTFDLPDSSDNDSYRSIIVPQRKLFSQQQRLTSKINYKQLQSQRESLESNKTVIDVKEISVSRRKLLNRGTRRTKLEFPAALLNLSANKSANNKTKESPNVEIKSQTRSLFGNKKATKRKNIFANFVLSDSEDEMPEVQPRIFAFKNINNNEKGTKISKFMSVNQIDVPENNNDDNHEEVSSDNVSLQYVEEQIDEDVEEEVCDEKEPESEEDINNDEDEEEECNEKQLESEEETNNVDEVEDNQSSIEENEDEQEIDNDLDDIEEMEHVSQHEIDQIEGDEDENIEKNNQYTNDENKGNNLNEDEQVNNKEIYAAEEKEEHQLSHPEIDEIIDENNEQNEDNREIQDEIVEREEILNLQQEVKDDSIYRDDDDNVIEEKQEANKEINVMKYRNYRKRASLQGIDDIEVDGDEINDASEEENETSKEIDDVDEPQEENVSLLTHRSAEAVLCEKRNMKSITINNRNRSTINNESMINKRILTPTLEPQGSSTRYSSDLRDSSGAGSGWDSHRVTRKTLRMTLGKDFSPRKSLRTLVMEKSVKRRTAVNPVEQEETGLNKSFKKVLEPSGVSINDDDISLDLTMESDHEASRIRQERAEYKDWIQKIRQKNLEVARKIEETVKENLARRSKDDVIFKVPAVPIQRNRGETKKPRKPQKAKEKVFPAGLPPEFFTDMKYKPPKRFAPRNAPWITKRLYKYLEDKLEPRYDYKARIRAEKLVVLIYEFTKTVRKHPVAAPVEDINQLKSEMAKLNIVKTHFDFNNFFDEFMPRGIRTKVIPNILNGLPLPRPDLFSEILLNNSSNH